MRSSRDFFVYPCEACGKRIFTERSHVGRKGRCPLCKAVHVVGGKVTAEDGVERRRAPRVKPPGAQVKLKRQTRGFSKAELLKEDSLAQDAYALEDLSQTGFAFRVPGVHDSRRLSGVAPPPIKIGERIQIALSSAGRDRAASYEAEVARVVPPEQGDELYLIGARFVGLSDIQHTELKSLVARMLAEGKP